MNGLFKGKKGGATKNWLKMPAGNWVVRVRAKNAAFAQRAKIVTSKGRFKVQLPVSGGSSLAGALAHSAPWTPLLPKVCHCPVLLN